MKNYYEILEVHPKASSQIIKKVYNDKYRRADLPLNFGSYVYDTNNTIMAYDKNTAKKLLMESGWKYSCSPGLISMISTSSLISIIPLKVLGS